MSLKGGYQIINFDGVALSDTAATVDGVYMAIANSNRKRCVCSGMVLDNEKMSDTEVLFTDSNGVFIGTFTVSATTVEDVPTLKVVTITVSADDSVILTSTTIS